MARYRPWARGLAGLVIVAFGLAATAAPAAGAERQIKASEAARPISASVAAAVASAPTPAPVVRLQEQQAPAPATDSPSFFRSPKGIAALVLFVGGVAFTLHSMDKDRIHSPVR